jgi:phosphohistidine phosphatase
VREAVSLARVRIVLVRHADAAPGTPDELRTLTREGREQARRLGERLRAEGIAPDAVLTSPLLRARETAEALGLGKPQPQDTLAPGATPEDVRAAVEGHGETVLVVGHQPDCSRIAAAISGGPEPAFPPAGVAMLELHS